MPTPGASVRFSSPVCNLESPKSRRAALLTGAGLAIAVTSGNTAAYADANDDAMAAIAARANAANEATKREKFEKVNKDEDPEAGKKLVTSVLLGSVVLSVPF